MPTILELTSATGHNRDTQLAGPGRNILKSATDVEFEADRSQLVVQARVNDCEIAIQHPEGTLAFQTSRSGAGLKITGFLDESGRIDRSQQRSPEEIPVWNERIRSALAAGAVGGR